MQRRQERECSFIIQSDKWSTTNPHLQHLCINAFSDVFISSIHSIRSYFHIFIVVFRYYHIFGTEFIGFKYLCPVDDHHIITSQHHKVGMLRSIRLFSKPVKTSSALPYLRTVSCVAQRALTRAQPPLSTRGHTPDNLLSYSRNICLLKRRWADRRQIGQGSESVTVSVRQSKCWRKMMRSLV